MTTYRLKATSGPSINQSFPLGETLTIGADGACDVPVEAGQGDGVLATVRVGADGSVRLSAATGSGVTVNGEPVTELDLAGGDELRVGRSRFILQAPGLRPERVLTDEATRPPRPTWPWWLAAALLAGAAALAWTQGWLPINPGGPTP